MRVKVLSCFLWACFALPLAASAQTPEEKGLAITVEADRRDEGYGDSVGELTMTLTNRQGQKSHRKLKIKTYEMTDPTVGDKSLVIFDQPRDIKGTVFLTHSKILESDDQWIFMPALGRIKRISSKNKSGPFMGSEFSFEDMASREVGKYSYKWLRDEACGSMTCHVIESVPLYEKSGYTKLISWVDQEFLQARKTEYYNRRGDLLKVLTLNDYHLYFDQYWRPGDLFMENKMTGKTTRLKWSRFGFHKGLKEKDFSKARIKTAK